MSADDLDGFAGFKKAPESKLDVFRLKKSSDSSQESGCAFRLQMYFPFLGSVFNRVPQGLTHFYIRKRLDSTGKRPKNDPMIHY